MPYWIELRRCCLVTPHPPSKVLSIHPTWNGTQVLEWRSGATRTTPTKRTGCDRARTIAWLTTKWRRGSDKRLKWQLSDREEYKWWITPSPLRPGSGRQVSRKRKGNRVPKLVGSGPERKRLTRRPNHTSPNRRPFRRPAPSPFGGPRRPLRSGTFTNKTVGPPDSRRQTQRTRSSKATVLRELRCVPSVGHPTHLPRTQDFTGELPRGPLANPSRVLVVFQLPSSRM